MGEAGRPVVADHRLERIEERADLLDDRAHVRELPDGGPHDRFDLFGGLGLAEARAEGDAEPGDAVVEPLRLSHHRNA